MITRRRFMKTLSVVPLVACLPRIARGQDIPDFAQLAAVFAQRLIKILSTRDLLYVDIESSCHSNQVDIDSVVKSMDQFNIGLMALSADIGKGQFEKGIRFDKLSKKLLTSYPDRFIPVGNGGQPPALTEAPDEFLDAQEEAARKKKIVLFGEFEFRHYPSPR